MTNDRPKPGYKRTEVGVIPEDWDILSLGEFLTFQNGVNADKSFYGHGIPFINISEVMAHTHLNASDVPGLVSLSKQATDLYRVYKGDILFNRTSEVQEELGLTSVYLDNEIVVFGGFVIRGRQKAKTLDIIYSAYALRSPSIRTQITSRGQGVVRANIGQKDLSEIQICVPPLPEQRSISQALSDVDRLIAALEKAIAKKRAIKTATMQQLLTGKKRLPGFGEGKGYQQTEVGAIPEDWKVIKLRDVLKIKHGRSQHEIVDLNGVYPVLATGGEIGRTNIPLYSQPSVLIGRKGTIDTPKYMDSPFWTVDTLFYSEISKNTDAKFVFYKFNLIDWYSYNEASGVPSLNAATIENIDQAFPLLEEEQRVIATVLSDMDAEIAALETRLAKTRSIKQGMMQQLLTGKVRLKIEAGMDAGREDD